MENLIICAISIVKKIFGHGKKASWRTPSSTLCENVLYKVTNIYYKKMLFASFFNSWWQNISLKANTQRKLQLDLGSILKSGGVNTVTFLKYLWLFSTIRIKRLNFENKLRWFLKKQVNFRKIACEKMLGRYQKALWSNLWDFC